MSSTSVSASSQVETSHRIGLSVSFCIAAIIRGEAREEEVEKIVAGTKCQTSEDWEEVIASYRMYYWRENPDLGEQIIRRFLAEGKIEQPRLDGRGTPLIHRTKWVDSLDQIKYGSTGY